MLKAVITLCFVFLFSLVCFGQGKVVFKANTEFPVSLESALATDKNNVGDDVNLVLTQDVAGEGETILKGSTIIGRIVNVEKSTAKDGTAKLCIMFDFVKKGEEFLSLVAAITTIEPNAEDIKFSSSKTFTGGTTLSLKGKEIQLDKGRILRLKLVSDITK